jgi:hypothetical protein
MPVVVVIVIIPIAIVVPPVAVFIPPAVPFIPAAFPRFAQFVPRVLRLPAVPAVMLRGFVQFVVCLGDAPLASVIVFGGCPWCASECQHAQESGGGQRCSSEELSLSRI